MKINNTCELELTNPVVLYFDGKKDKNYIKELGKDVLFYNSFVLDGISFYNGNMRKKISLGPFNILGNTAKIEFYNGVSIYLRGSCEGVHARFGRV